MSRTHQAEYPLPFHVEDLHLVPPLDPWLARFSGLSGDQVAEILRKEWDAIRTPAVASFRDAIHSFRPISLFDDGMEDEWYQGWWLRMERPATETAWEKEVLLHAPPDRAALVECLAGYGLPNQDVMNEFYFHSYKMRNAKDNGSAFYEPPWLRFHELGWYDDIDQDHPDPHREWAEANLLYTTFTGDMVLMKDSGEVGWALAAEQRTCPLAPTFSNFVEQCAIWYQDRGVLDYYNWVKRFSQE
jgi:hypothetical protein